MQRLTLLVLLLAAAQGCLPADDRPEPGSVLVNVQRSEVGVDGFTTDDGWTISFDRFVTAIGDMGLTGDGCVDYSNATYDRLYDFTVADYSKVSLHYGLGPCTIGFSIAGPQEDAILMAGVTPADRTLMSTRATDLLQDGHERPVSVMVVGRAVHADETKQFSWLIRGSRHVGACYTPARDTNLSAIELNAGDSSARDLEVRPQELFRHTPSLAAALEFERLAQADKNGDGIVTLAELAAVPVSAAEIIADLADEMPDRSAADIAQAVGSTPTLASLVFSILSTRIVAFAGAGECVFGERSRDFGAF